MRAARSWIALFLGVTSTCLAQTPTWTQKCPPASPPARAGNAMAYDSAHAQVVLFGGTAIGGTTLGDTWIWDGTTWTEKFPATNPSARSGMAMAYDAAHGQVVMFGGVASSAYLSETWVWDGSDWTQEFPATNPSPRQNAGFLTYDIAHQQILMFGGSGLSSVLNDTWVWDGTNWIQEFPANTPPPRSAYALAYDAVRQQVVLFGGSGSISNPPVFLGDTWVWDGTNWTQKFPATSPPIPMWDYGLAFDAAHGQVLLFGGSGPSGSPLRGDTWGWDGTTWSQLTTATAPSPRYVLAMTYDSALGGIVLFGGTDNSTVLDDTWVWGAPTPTTCPVPPPTITSILPTSGNQGETISNFTVNGSNFQPGAIVSFSGDAGVSLRSVTIAPSQIVGNLNIAIIAAVGSRDITVTNPDGQKVTMTSAFTVNAASAPSQPVITISPTALTFGSVTPRGSQTQTLTITNSGTAPLLIYSIGSLGNLASAFSFRVSNPSSTAINPNDSATVTVTFSPFPGTSGTINALLGITSNTPTRNTYVTMSGTVATVNRPLSLLPIDSPLPNPPLDIQPILNHEIGNRIVTGFLIRNLTDTWYEISLDTSSPPANAPTLVGFSSMQIPNPSSFMIGPHETLQRFPRNGQPLSFSAGQYLKFKASDLSFKAGGAFALDMLLKGLFGVGLRSVDLSTQMLSQLADAVGNVCIGNDRQMLLDASANNAQAVAWDDILLMGCLVQSSPALVDGIANLLAAKIGVNAAAAWLDIAPALATGSVGIPLAINFLTLDVPMALAQFTAPSTGHVLLEVPLPEQ
jgi:hypothetical protein